MTATTTKSTGKRGRPVGSRNKIKGDNLPIYTKTCAFCGKQDSTVTERTDPYASDVNGDDTLYNICDTCHSDKEDDI